MNGIPEEGGCTVLSVSFTCFPSEKQIFAHCFEVLEGAYPLGIAEYYPSMAEADTDAPWENKGKGGIGHKGSMGQELPAYLALG